MANPRLTKFFIGFVVILGALLYLAFTGYEESKAYYRTVEEVQALGANEARLRYRVGGDVEDGSVEWVGSGVNFRLVQDEHVLNVEYRGEGPVPDTFRDGSQTIVEGKMRDDGTFEAVKIQAKCASKYEADYDYDSHSVNAPEGGDT